MRLFSIQWLVTTLSVLFLLLPACSSNQSTSADHIAWQSYSEGLQAAGTQGKKTFLYFRADW